MKTTHPTKESRLKKTGRQIKRGMKVSGQGIWAACVEMSLRQDVSPSAYGEKFRHFET